MSDDIYVDHRGDDWIIPITITQTVGETTTPYDLSGATLTATIEASGGSPGWTGTPTVISAPAGTLTITVPAAVTTLFPPSTYAADIQSVKAGVKDTIYDFEIEVLKDVTRT